MINPLPCYRDDHESDYANVDANVNGNAVIDNSGSTTANTTTAVEKKTEATIKTTKKVEAKTENKAKTEVKSAVEKTKKIKTDGSVSADVKSETSVKATKQ